MDVVRLLTDLAAIGATLTRLPGDRIEAKGDLSPDLRERLVAARGELLTILPPPRDPREECRDLHRAMVARVNAACPPGWTGGTDDLERLAVIEQDAIAPAIAAGDVEATRLACETFEAAARQVFLIDTLTFPGDCSACGFTPNPAICPRAVCPAKPCAETIDGDVSLPPACRHDAPAILRPTIGGDKLFCSACGRRVGADAPYPWG